MISSCLMANRSQATTLLTFESWVTKWEWYIYARDQRHWVPYLLVDRSLCEEPFFDAFARSPAERQPVISGICRVRKNFEVGDKFIYRTRVDPRVRESLRLYPATRYMAVAAMVVTEVSKSHEDASLRFLPRRYVVAPVLTAYPPNLVHASAPATAVDRRSCIVFKAREQGSAITPGERRPLTPVRSTEEDRRSTYSGYHDRMLKRRLRAALCKMEVVNGCEALVLDPLSAPVLTADEYGRESGNGLLLPEELAAPLRGRIAAAGGAVLR